MKNNRIWAIVIIWLLATPFASFSQYYQNDYGTQPFEIASWGEVSQFGDHGNLISGHTRVLSAPQARRATVIRTNPAGLFVNGSIGFGYNYDLFQSSGPVWITTCFASETNQNTIQLGGTYLENGQHHFYHAIIDGKGNPIDVNVFKDPNYVQNECLGVYNDQNNGIYFLLGSSIAVATGKRLGTILAFEIGTGNYLWGNVYDIGTNPTDSIRAYDAEFNPNTNEIVVVGSIGDSIKNDGFVFTIDPYGNLSGSISSPILFGAPDDDDVFTAVTVKNGTTDGGIIMAGYSNKYGNNDAWAVTGDNNLSSSSIISVLVDHAGMNNSNKAFTVVERVNQGGVPHYYIGGIAKFPNGNQTFDISDIYLFDQNLSLLSNFIDGNISNGSACLQLGIYEIPGMPDPGLVSLGRSFAWFYDYRITKFYFNGYTACNNLFQNSPTYQGSTEYNSFATSTQAFFSEDAEFVIVSPVNQWVRCNATHHPNGNNFKTTQTHPTLEINATHEQLTISITNNGKNQVEGELIITDVMGRIWHSQSITLNEGQQSFNLPYPTLQGQAAGIYLVTLRSAEGTTTKRIFID